MTDQGEPSDHNALTADAVAEYLNRVPRPPIAEWSPDVLEAVLKRLEAMLRRKRLEAASQGNSVNLRGI